VSTRVVSDASGTPDTVGDTGGLWVRAVFHDLDERKAQAISAEMIARAHELANTPEWECDVDVSVEVLPSRADGSCGDGAL
jgi:hypothetical protein